MIDIIPLIYIYKLGMSKDYFEKLNHIYNLNLRGYILQLRFYFIYSSKYTCTVYLYHKCTFITID